MARSIRLPVQELVFDALAEGPERGPLILFLHGFPDFAMTWAPLMALAAGAGYRCVAVDQRGASPGARPDSLSGYGLDRLVDDVLAFGRALGADRFHVVGQDWGALVGWRCAALHPDRVETVTGIAVPAGEALLHAVRTDPDQRRRSRYGLLLRGPVGRAEAVLLGEDARVVRQLYDGVLAPEAIDIRIARLRAGALTGGLAWYRGLTALAPAGPLTLPSLLAWGRQDPFIGPRAVDLHGRYAGAASRRLILDDAGHWLHLTHTAALWRAMADLMPQPAPGAGPA